jgi:hypothetical protein
MFIYSFTYFVMLPPKIPPLVNQKEDDGGVKKNGVENKKGGDDDKKGSDEPKDDGEDKKGELISR